MDDREDPWSGGSREPAWQKKRRISNQIGLFVLVALALTIGGYKAIEWLNHRNKVKDTQATLKTLCRAFAKNDKTVIADWAAGKYKDVWGNHIILHSDDRTKVVFVSKGPDGILDTPDDIRSEEVRPSTKPETQAALKANVEPGPSLAEIQQKVEGAVDEVKKAAESGEAKGENGGWKWRFRWGRDKSEK